MKALVFHGPKDIRYEDFPDPGLSSPHHAIIEVSHCSICGSDLHLYHGEKVGQMDFSMPQPQFCVGHETIGKVVEIGKSVKNLRVGDRLLVAGGAGCGLCKFCKAGDLRRCTSDRPAMVYGFSPYLNGGQADYLEVFAADNAAMKIPDGVSDEQALLMTDAAATGHFGLVGSRFEPGDSVAVIGQGPVGLMAAEVAMALGASRVFTIDPIKARRELSRGFGATPLHPDEARNVIMEETGGVGVDRVVEAVGLPDTITQSIRLVRPGGGVGIVGIVLDGDWGAVPFLRRAQGKSVSVMAGIANILDSWPTLMDLFDQGRIKGDGVFTHSFDLKDGADAYTLFDERADGVVKIMIKP